MNPDQTPTPDTDAEFSRIVQNELLETSQGGEYDALRALRRFARTLERQRDTARAEAKEAKEVVASLLQNSDSLRAEVARLTKERDEAMASLPWSTNRTRGEAASLLGEVLRHVTDEKLQSSHGCVEVTHAQKVVDGLIGDVECLRAELTTLQATRDADHGAAIETTVKACVDEVLAPPIESFGDVIARHMRALVATVTNSQLSAQGGGQTCNRDEESSSPAYDRYATCVHCGHPYAYHHSTEDFCPEFSMGGKYEWRGQKFKPPTPRK